MCARNSSADRLVALLAIALALVPVVCVSAITGYAAWANMVMGASCKAQRSLRAAGWRSVAADCCCA